MMYINSQIRYNSKIEDKDLYYWIVESYRIDGKRHSEIMLEIGFMEEKLSHFQIDAISSALNARWKEFQGYKFPSKDEATLQPKVKEYLDKFWKTLLKSGKLAEVHAQKSKDFQGQEQCISFKSRSEKYSGTVGVSWFLLQFLQKIELRDFLRNQGFSEKRIYAALVCLIAFTATPFEPKYDYEFEYRTFLDESALEKLIQALARGEGYNRKFPSYEEIISVPAKLWSMKRRLEKFLFSVIHKFCPELEPSDNDSNSANVSNSVIKDFTFYVSNGNLNKTGRHRADYIERFMPLNHPTLCKNNIDWYNSNLFVGWISYVITSIIRHNLKKSGITTSWNNVLFRFYSQSMVITSGLNYKGDKVSYCACTSPSEEAKKIYDAFCFETCPPPEVSITEN